MRIMAAPLPDRRRLQHRRAIGRDEALLDLELLEQQRRRRRRHRHPAALGAAHAVEGLDLAARRADRLQRDQRRAADVDAADQLAPAVGVQPVGHHRVDLERLGRERRGVGEPAADVGEDHAVRPVLRLDLLDQHLLELGGRHAPGDLDDEVALARDRRQARLSAGRGRWSAANPGIGLRPIRKPTSLPWSTRLDPARAHALVVEAIEAVELDAVERDDLRVVVDATASRARCPCRRTTRTSGRWSASFWRWPSMRWPNTSWKNTPAARPSRIAGPTYGSASGASCSASRSPVTVAIILSTSASPRQVGRRAAEPLLEPRQVHAVVGLDPDRDRELGVGPRRAGSGCPRC